MAGETKAEQPGAIVELGVVLDDLGTIVTDDECVDTLNAGLRHSGKAVSPGDGVAAIPRVEGLNGDFGLAIALALVESLLAGESYSAKLFSLVAVAG